MIFFDIIYPLLCLIKQVMLYKPSLCITYSSYPRSRVHIILTPLDRSNWYNTLVYIPHMKHTLSPIYRKGKLANTSHKKWRCSTGPENPIWDFTSLKANSHSELNKIRAKLWICRENRWPVNSLELKNQSNLFDILQKVFFE